MEFHSEFNICWLGRKSELAKNGWGRDGVAKDGRYGPQDLQSISLPPPQSTPHCWCSLPVGGGQKTEKHLHRQLGLSFPTQSTWHNIFLISRLLSGPGSHIFTASAFAILKLLLISQNEDFSVRTHQVGRHCELSVSVRDFSTIKIAMFCSHLSCYHVKNRILELKRSKLIFRFRNNHINLVSFCYFTKIEKCFKIILRFKLINVVV